MATAPESGLPSPSPSGSELDKTAIDTQNEESRHDVPSILTLADEVKPLDCADGEADADLIASDRENGSDTKSTRGRSKKKKKKQRSRSGSGSDVSPYSTDSSSVNYPSYFEGFPARRRRFVEGYSTYIKLLEDRIVKLENGIVSRQPRSRRDSSVCSSVNLGRRSTQTIPDLKVMCWEEYLEKKGSIMPDKCHAIDVLIDEPILFHQRNLKKHGHDAAIAGQLGRVAPRGARRSDGLPSRIRINSEMIMHFLWRASKERFAFGGRAYSPRVILRPFKVLYLFETELKDLLAEIEGKLKAKEDASSVAKDTSQPEAINGIASGVVHVESGDAISGNDEDAHPRSRDLEANPEGEGPSLGVDVDGNSTDGLDPRGTWAEIAETEYGVKQLRCLIRFIDEYLLPVEREYASCQREKVRFSELWHLLKPLKLAYVVEKNVPQHIWKIVQVTGGRPFLSPWNPPPPGPPEPPPPDVNTRAPPLPPLRPGPPVNKSIAPGYDEISPLIVECEYTDYNGVRFGPIFRKFYIEPFEDERDIKSLSIMPYNYATKFGLVKEEALRERGEKFLEVTKPSHRYHSGKTLVRTPLGGHLLQTYEEGSSKPGPPIPVSEETIESEVMVDFDRTFSSNPLWSPRLGDEVIFEMIDNRECREPSNDITSEHIDNDMLWDRQMLDDAMAIINIQSQRYYSGAESPKGDDVLLLPSRVFAFILRSRKWGKLHHS